MIVGAAVARQRRYLVIGVLIAAMALLTVSVAIPARTAPIPGGVAELATVGERHLGVMIRGASPRLPVLLFVPGAPGGSEFGAMRQHLAGLERHFVVATMDRRGGGSSYPALDPTSTVTVGSAVEDIGVVADYLRRRFGQDRIYLLGHSGGSILAVLAVRDRPERYRAYIGTGQAVDLTDSDRLFYADILAWARATGRADVARRMAAQGPPPYGDVYGYESIMTYGPEAYGQSPGAFAIGVPEYTLLQKVHTLTAILDTWDALYPRMQDVDLRIDAPRLQVPVYFVQGANEMRGLAVVFADWYARLQAPARHLDVVAGGGHRVMFERPDRFIEILTRIRTETTGVSS
jgi:pimeloyl-ACP methyl ester carboxylesterase